MPKSLVLFFVIVCLMLVPVASSQLNSAAARTSMDTTFFVGDAQLPAGEYVFSFDSSTNRMRITNADTQQTVFVSAQERVEDPTPTENKLKFRNDGGQLVLHKVWLSRTGRQYDILHDSEVIELD